MHEWLIWLALASALQALWFVPLWLLRDRLESALPVHWCHRLWMLALAGMTLWPILALWIKQPPATELVWAAENVPAELQLAVPLTAPYSWAGIAPCWLVGLAGLALWFALQVRRSQRLTAASCDLSSVHQRRFSFWIQRFAMRRCIEGRQVPNRATPCTTGWVRPRVLYPNAGPVMTELNDFDAATCHELAHVKRWDTVRFTLAWSLCALFFFNPLTWIALRLMRESAELSCDAMAIAMGVKPKKYAALMLQLATHQQQRMRLACAMASPVPLLERRIKQMLTQKRTRKTWLALALLVSCFGLQGMRWMPDAPQFTDQDQSEMTQDTDAEQAQLEQELEMLRRENAELRARMEHQLAREAETLNAERAERMQEAEKRLREAMLVQKEAMKQQQLMLREQLQAERAQAMTAAQQREVAQAQMEEMKRQQMALREQAQAEQHEFAARQREAELEQIRVQKLQQELILKESLELQRLEELDQVQEADRRLKELLRMEVLQNNERLQMEKQVRQLERQVHEFMLLQENDEISPSQKEQLEELKIRLQRIKEGC